MFKVLWWQPRQHVEPLVRHDDVTSWRVMREEGEWALMEALVKAESKDQAKALVLLHWPDQHWPNEAQYISVQGLTGIDSEP